MNYKKLFESIPDVSGYPDPERLLKLIPNNPLKNNMRHVENAALKFLQKKGVEANKFLSIENLEDVKGVAPIVKFTIQSDPISEVGVNGLQAVDMLEYVKCLFESLNEAFPCIENEYTINDLKSALAWQDARTKDRERRKVEGTNQK